MTPPAGRRRIPSPPRASRRGAGVALLEALLALCLLAVVLGALGGTLVGALRTSARGGEAARRADVERAAVAALREELGRAGYAPSGGGPPLETAPARDGGDAIVVRYVDDVWRDPPAPVEATWEAGRDGDGRPALYRRLGGLPRQPAVEGVEDLRAAFEGDVLRVDLTFAWGGVRTLWVAAP